MATIAIEGGSPVRATMLAYARQIIDDDDRRAVDEVLRGDWLTTGPMVKAFEEAISAYTTAPHAVAVNTGTAALHAAVWAAGIRADDEVIVPAISFVASANCVLYMGAKPVFADLSADTLNIDPEDIERKITSKTKAIIAVDFAGHPADHDAISAIAKKHGLVTISDAAHSLGGRYKGRKVGTLQDLTALSFHPVKQVTTGEGGMILTADETMSRRMRSFRHHGIDLDVHQRSKSQSWQYDVNTLGYNYRIPDINCALGLSQLSKLDRWLERREQIAQTYKTAFAQLPQLQLPTVRDDVSSAWHLYVIRLAPGRLTASRDKIFEALRAENIGVNVHYIPIPWLSHYASLGYTRGNWPVAEDAHSRMISLPMFPGMSDTDVHDVIAAVTKVVNHYSA
ncbi:UDP-4-amino-4,6-dideoxy-N-acetyl-beta-L-altrosamine transaminase [Herbaspirillum sp. alder98]|uniref:UDP-4-amino-4, 6-dideoxy-N-acetyl-beta-L-altrosamine transaminase n=1 Tax=Herbaspirillum sp. alder98 TaxID=2913096 RepID=UPI001CD91001|nr:UDP-4-amino-4,6-dideoxy-N-acetyl-beta-L-altrosamine transaminase [Herbaspirillum sp. alder98]MCA1324307.1 UDP-4-amino-4,6-dideoxy-N-acetyl-beta-L-altrosamine transaminase [Herbaspirillum sp. alder98]